MKKIMFNNKYGLTKAVLEGRKTMTRRIILDELMGRYEDMCRLGTPLKTKEEFLLEHSRYQIGEVVAVAQNYDEVFDEFATIVYLQDKPVPDNFKAFGRHSDVTLPRTMPGWENKMFVRADLMPHQIRITGVRVERLQDISDEDCIREGIYEDCPGVQYSYPTKNGYCGQYPFDSPRTAFAALFDKLSGKGTWDSNPYVHVYDFELVK